MDKSVSIHQEKLNTTVRVPEMSNVYIISDILQFIIIYLEQFTQSIFGFWIIYITLKEKEYEIMNSEHCQLRSLAL